MSHQFVDRNELLPADFLSFLSKNYETIHEIEKKVEQFQNDPWNNFYKRFGCRNWRNMRLCSIKCDSVDSCFSDRDIKKVIRARLRPKMKKLASNERLEVDESYLDEIKIDQQETSVDFSYLSHNFPLVYFAPEIVTPTKTKSPSNKSLEIPSSVSISVCNTNPRKLAKLLVKGNKVALSARASTLGATTKPNNLFGKREKVSRPRRKFFNGSDYSYSSDESSSVETTISSENTLFNGTKKEDKLEPPRSRQLLTVRI